MTDRNEILSAASAVYGQAVDHRRHLHAHPELSFAEHATAEYIAAVLSEAGIDHRRIAGTGILAKIEGRGDLSKAIVLRADTDALPIQEQTGLGCASASDGVMHACGHDMHTAALLGALKILNDRREDIEGTVFGLFQPGEEACPGGASLVLAEKPFEGYDIRAFVGEHVEPELPTGVFGFREGQYMAANDEIRITVRGKGGHGAMRGTIKDPVAAAAAIVTALLEIPPANGDLSVPTPAVLSIGKLTADGATNVIPDRAYMEGTLRTFDEGMRAEIKREIRATAQAVAARYGAEADVDITDGYPSVVNDPALTRKAAALTKELFGDNSAVPLDLRTTSEDFGFYTRLYPSVFYRFGVGGESADGCPAGTAGRLHTSIFNPDEGALEYAAAELAWLALNLSK